MSARPQRAVPFREAAIDLAQLTRNVARLRELRPGSPVVVDVGANAWGHGLSIVVPALDELGVEAFVVGRLDEAAEVRALAADTPIISTQHSTDETFEVAAALAVTPALRSRVEYERSITAGVRSVVFVEDDGAGQPGFALDELSRAAEDATERGIVVLTTLARATVGPEAFGVSEHDSENDSETRFGPVLRLWAPVTATKRVDADEGVSYGHTYRTPAETTLTLVPLGYGDGLARAGSNRVSAVVDGVVRIIAGRIAMDAFMLDVGDTPTPILGSEAAVLGAADRGEPTAAQHARALGTHSAEITTHLTARVHRYATRQAS